MGGLIPKFGKLGVESVLWNRTLIPEESAELECCESYAKTLRSEYTKQNQEEKKDWP